MVFLHALNLSAYTHETWLRFHHNSKLFVIQLRRVFFYETYFRV